MKKQAFLTALCLVVVMLLVNFKPKKLTAWKTITPNSLPSPRHENSFARVGDKLYLMGGRKILHVDAYDLKKNTWEKKSDAPLEINHFQAVSFKDEVYIVGAFTGGYPHEKPIPRIYIYNPKADKWREGAEIPEARRRGSAGVTVYKNKIYVVCGIIDGHWDGHVTWVDEFDPATGTWRVLPDAPHARDHISIAVANDKIVVAGGRKSTARIGKVLDLTVPEVDIFDFKTNTWTTMPAAQNIPTQRAGNSAVSLGSKVIFIGGESPQKLSHKQAEAFDVRTNTWEAWPSMQTGRHGTGAIVYKNKIYTAAGSANQGGGPELNSLEVLE